MSAQEPNKVEVVAAEVTSAPGDALEIELELRVEKLEADESEQATTIRAAMLGVIGLQEASLKHSVALGLLLAVLFFIASRALGA